MSDWFKSRVTVIRALFFLPLPIVLAIWAWGPPALIISFFAVIIFAVVGLSTKSANTLPLWCLCATTSSVIALRCLTLINPAALPGALSLEGFLYPLLYLIAAIVLFPKIKE